VAALLAEVLLDQTEQLTQEVAVAVHMLLLAQAVQAS
jgi:hypothetical protein